MEKIKVWVRNNKNIAVLALAVLLVAALAVATNYIKQSRQTAVNTEKPAGEECVDGLCPGTTEPEATPADNPSYEDAIRMYVGKTIVFGGNCEATPSAYTTKVGTRVLFTNSSKTVLNITASGKSVILRPYRYFTSTLKTPGSYPITCNGANAATITVK